MLTLMLGLLLIVGDTLWVVEGELAPQVDSVSMAETVVTLPSTPGEAYPIAWIGGRPWRCTENFRWPYPPEGDERGWELLFHSELEPHFMADRVPLADLLPREDEQEFLPDPGCLIRVAELGDPGPGPVPGDTIRPGEIPYSWPVAVGGISYQVLRVTGADTVLVSSHSTQHGADRVADRENLQCRFFAEEPCEVVLQLDQVIRYELRWLYPPEEDLEEDEDLEDEVGEPDDPVARVIQHATASGRHPAAMLPSDPIPGNTLVAFSWHRVDWAAPDIGPGWRLEALHVEPSADVGSQHRKGVAVWTRPVTEGTGRGIAVTWAPQEEDARHAGLMVLEVEGSWSVIDAATVSSGATEPETLSVPPPGQGTWTLGLLAARDPVSLAAWVGAEPHSAFVTEDPVGVTTGQVALAPWEPGNVVASWEPRAPALLTVLVFGRTP